MIFTYRYNKPKGRYDIVPIGASHECYGSFEYSRDALREVRRLNTQSKLPPVSHREKESDKFRSTREEIDHRRSLVKDWLREGGGVASEFAENMGFERATIYKDIQILKRGAA